MGCGRGRASGAWTNGRVLVPTPVPRWSRLLQLRANFCFCRCCPHFSFSPLWDSATAEEQDHHTKASQGQGGSQQGSGLAHMAQSLVYADLRFAKVVGGRSMASQALEAGERPWDPQAASAMPIPVDSASLPSFLQQPLAWTRRRAPTRTCSQHQWHRMGPGISPAQVSAWLEPRRCWHGLWEVF